MIARRFDYAAFDTDGQETTEAPRRGTKRGRYAAIASLATWNRIAVDDVPFFVTPAGLLEARASLVALRRRLRKYA